jgi:hypothetical protein
MAAALSAKSVAGSSAKLATRKANKSTAVRMPVVVRAQKENVEAPEMTRRAAMGMLAGVAAMVAGASPSQAAYGDAANVFGKITNTSGFVPYAGEGFTVLLPSKWNPSKETDLENLQLRYEDNFDAVNNVAIVAQPTDKSSIDQLGSSDAFAQNLGFLFGKQAFAGETISEGGFAPGRVSAASLLGVSESTDSKGKKYYRYEFLTRSADGNEGGRHILVSATVSGGKLWICRTQIGDKRWFKGANKEAQGLVNSFTVA